MDLPPAACGNHVRPIAPPCDRDVNAFERVVRAAMDCDERGAPMRLEAWNRHRSLTACVEAARDREEERAARAAMLLADGRVSSLLGVGDVLLEIILKAQGDARSEDGTHPAACEEIQKLIGTKTVGGAMSSAGYAIALAVGWRMIEIVRPTVAAELAAGVFFISDLRELVRKAFSLRLSFEANGELTPVLERLKLKADSGVDFFTVVDEAAKRGKERREADKVRRMELAAFYQRRAPRNAQGEIVGLQAAIKRVHEQNAEAEAPGWPGYVQVVDRMTVAQVLGADAGDGGGGGGGNGAPSAAAATSAKERAAGTRGLRKRAAAGTSGGEDTPPAARRRRRRRRHDASVDDDSDSNDDDSDSDNECSNDDDEDDVDAALAATAAKSPAPVTPLFGGTARAAPIDDDELEALFAASRNKYGDALELECVSSDAFESWAPPLLAGLSLDAAGGGNTMMLGAEASLATAAIEVVVPSVPIMSHLCQALCGAGNLLLIVGGSRAFLQHRSVFAGSPPLLGLGVGESFTSLLVVKHDYYHHGVAKASCRPDVCCAPMTRVVSLWVDPARLFGGCGLASSSSSSSSLLSSSSSSSSFELVFDAAAAIATTETNDDDPEPGSVVPLVHGTVLVSKATETGGACELGYKVRAARGSGVGGGGGAAAATPTARLVELVFFVSRDVQAACSELGDVQVRIDMAKAVAALPP